MEWSTTSNIHNVSVAFMPPPLPESNSSNSFPSFKYDDFYGVDTAGNSYWPACTQTQPVVSVQESENIINAYQCEGNNEKITKKNKRLTSEQIASLEESFQEDIKLDSYKKLKLAENLGLQPRQVAVWFQNRRARWKVKHLEESYDSLKREHDFVWKENQLLHDEVKNLRAIILRDQCLTKRQSTNMSSNQMAEGNQLGQRNNPMLVASSSWPSMARPSYPW